VRDLGVDQTQLNGVVRHGWRADLGGGGGDVLVLLSRGVCCRGFVGCAVHLSLELLFLFPLRVGNLLVGGQQGVDLAVGILGDSAAGLVIGLFVGGGIGAEAVQCYVKVKQGHAELDDLVLVEVELFLKHSELAGGPDGRRNDLLSGGGGIAGVGSGVAGLGIAGAGDPDEES